MKLFRFITGLTMAILLAGPVMGQKRDLVVQADKTFSVGEYFKAAEKYKKAYAKEKDRQKRMALTVKIGICYRLVNDTRKAESYFSRVVKQKSPDPKTHLYYAEVLKINGKLDLAKKEYEEYLKSEPGDLMALEAYQSCDSIQTWTKNLSRYQVANVKDFNSKFNDYSPFFASRDYKELYISSSRDGAVGNKIHGGTGQSFSDIFYTRLDNKQKWAVPTPVDKVINSIYDDGAPWVTEDGSTMYFTRCRYDKQMALGCQIMMAKRSGTKWMDPVAVPISKDSVVIAHPSLTEDQLTIFFVSDMLGSIGGKDIWMAKREKADGPFGPPNNLGPEINTPKDEMFPFVKTDSLFYFSSNGHPGMGGLDIFKAQLKPDGKWQVENMKAPLNSSADDFGIVFQKDEEKGYFTSSRLDKSKGGDEIYSFVLPEKRFNMVGRVINERTTMPLGGADVRLIGSDGTSFEYKTDSTGNFSFKLKEETDYLLVAFKKGFLNGKLRETTMGLEASRDFNATLVLAPYEKPIELPNILYDLAKWDLRPESMVALDALVETLEDNPNITIELMSHTDIRPFRAMTNLELSQNRAQSVVDYLISKGIASDRLKARGYGPDVPRVVDEKIAAQYKFLNVADTLSKGFIDLLPNDQDKEIAHQLNRRTEFRVLRNDYVPGGQPGNEIDAQKQILMRGMEELQQGKKKIIKKQ
ncbi:MAG: OmpA family protein [Bacteroidales bacterium]|jgi:peptidoglycan-associated lipoprotein